MSGSPVRGQDRQPTRYYGLHESVRRLLNGKKSSTDEGNALLERVTWGGLETTEELPPIRQCYVAAVGQVGSILIISIFCTGMGLISPLPQDGAVIVDTTHQLTTPVPVLFPGPDNACSGATPSCTEAQITYEGAAPTLLAGVIQVNVRLPASFPDYLTLPGPVPIKMRIPNGPITQVLATVAVQ